MMNYLIRVFVLLAFILSFDSVAISIEEAYRAIPHAKTDFVTNRSKLNPLEKIYLNQLFNLVNQAIVQRVETLAWFQTSGQRGANHQTYRREIRAIKSDLNDLSVPTPLQPIHSLVVQAIQAQSEYFVQWQEKVSKKTQYRFQRRDPLIQSSHRKLISAYKQLMKLYAYEVNGNKKAFFDHLCALDFI